MIAENFIDLIDQFDQHSSTDDIKEFNGLILKLEGKQSSETESYLFSRFRSLNDTYLRAISKDSFRWSKEVGEELKKFFTHFEHLKSPLFTEFANCAFLQSIFDIRNFHLITSVNIGRVGGSPSYDESLRALSYMLRFFLNVYLRKVLVFKPVLKSSSVHIFDPCFREKLRERNQTDPEILRGLFAEGFNIKAFVLQCLTNYFPNVSWRWLGGKQFAHYMTLKMILILFEYGLWKLEEIDLVIEKVYSASEILSNLETYLERDITNQNFAYSQVEEWTVVSTKCRKKIGSIFLHIMLMHLDTEIMSAVPKFKIPLAPAFANYPLHVSKTATEIENLFYVKRFKKKRLYTYFSYSLITYLIRPVHFKNASTAVTSKSLTDIICLLIGYVSEMENNMFNISLNTFQSETFSFYSLANNSPIYEVPRQFEEKFKVIINKIKLGGYETLNFENAIFFNEVEELYRQIKIFFGSVPKSLEVYSGYQLAFALTSIPQYILSLLNFISDMGPSEKKVCQIVKLGVSVLISLCHENKQAINSIFSHYNFKHISKLLENDIINGVYLVTKLFGKASTLYILEKNQDIFEKLISSYAQVLQDFCEEINKWREGGKIEEESFKASNMAAVMIYNKLFRRILKNSQQKNFKFQILIQNQMHLNCKDLLSAIIAKTVSEIPGFEDNPDHYKKIENFLQMTSSWNQLTQNVKESVLYEAIYLTLSLFEESIKKVYTFKIYNCFNQFFKATQLTEFFGLTKSKFGVRIFKVVVQIFRDSMIFHQNHLLNRETLLVNKNDIKVEEFLCPEQVEPYIYAQLILLIAPVKEFIMQKGCSQQVMNFLLAALMPAIFKQYSGLLTHLTENKFKEFRSGDRLKFVDQIKTFLDFALFIKETFKKSEGPKDLKPDTNIFIVSFKELYREINPMYFFQQTLNPEVDTFRILGYQLIDVIFDLYLYNEKKVIHISELLRYNYYYFEESVQKIMKDKLDFLLKFRNEGQAKSDKKIVLWDKSTKSIKAYKEMQIDTIAEASMYTNLKNFDFEIPDEENTKFIKSMQIEQQFNEQIVQNVNLNFHTEWSKSSKNTYIQNVIVYFKERYKFMKNYFLEHDNKNQIFIVFRLEDVIKKNVELFIDFFFNQIKLLDITFDNLAQNFFSNEFYYSLFILMDNLIRTSKNYRMTFYTKIDAEGNFEVMEKIWKLHRMLLDYCLYSTFLDNSWKQIFTSYYLISNFIQNLCEDNFFLFKRWFCLSQEYLDNQSSVVEVYYSLIESALMNTELAQYNRQQLTLADKPELFFVYNRLIEGMTEFINGGRTLGQQIVYQKRIDIWVGIIMRVIDDVESTFYVLKNNVLLYITATLEGLDRKIVEFVASNFSVSLTFKLIVRLMKKLYIRQLRLKGSRGFLGADRGQMKAINTVTEEDEKMHSVGSYDTMMDYYMKYEDTFSDHVIMESLVSLHSFVGAMASGVVRYKNFLDEIEAAANAKFVQQKNFQNEDYDMDSITIWFFLKSIIVSMEILYKDASNEEQLKPKLTLHQFKKLPICFFLTQSVKDNFFFYVKIDSIDLKHDEFFEKSRYHMIIMRDLRIMYKKSKFLFYALTEEAFKIYMLFLYALAVAINILFLILYRNTNKEFLRWNAISLPNSITVLAVTDAILAFCILVLWLLFKFPTVNEIKWEEYYLVNSRSRKPPLTSRLYITFFRSIIMKKHFRTFFLHILLSLLGLFVSPFFYSLLLLMIVDLSFLVHSVIFSFITNYDKLAYTLLMIVVVINFFAFIASDAFAPNFTHSEETQLLCVTYFTCLVNSVNVGLRAGGGLADKMLLQSDNQTKTFEGRFFFDVMFFILVNLFMLGMFFGIIVDSFKEQRDQMEDRKQDRENYCFTCGLNRDVLEKAGLDFGQHIEYHKIWNYLFYIIYLEWKPKNSYDGVDLYVSEKMESNNRHEWMPIGQTLKFKKEKSPE